MIPSKNDDPYFNQFTRIKIRPRTRREKFVELVTELLSPTEIVVTVATLCLSILLVLILAATVYSTYYRIPPQ